MLRLKAHLTVTGDLTVLGDLRLRDDLIDENQPEVRVEGNLTLPDTTLIGKVVVEGTFTVTGDMDDADRWIPEDDG
jgi:hypothetical protein